MKDWAKLIGVSAFIALVIVVSIDLERAHWNECRRIHPWWYCLESGAK